MAVELFDTSQIDSAVGDAFGTKVKSRPSPAAAPAPAVAPAPAQSNQASVISDQLLDRLRKVEIDFKALIILILIFRLVFWLGR